VELQCEGPAPWGRLLSLPVSSYFMRAGDGNRTRTTSLEGWNSTIELRPRVAFSADSSRGQ
jgi:hypothetical protein